MTTKLYERKAKQYTLDLTPNLPQNSILDNSLKQPFYGSDWVETRTDRETIEATRLLVARAFIP